MSEPHDTRPTPLVAGRIGVTLLCVYLLGVTLRIGGCYAPDQMQRDELPSVGPAVGDPFPAFALRDTSGVEVRSEQLRGATTIVAIVPSLDWSPPSKARVLDLAEALRERRAADDQREVRIAVVLPSAQATPRSLAFVRDRELPFFVLIDDAGMIDRLALGAPAPDGTAAAVAATFVLDAEGRVILRDVRKDARAWPDAALVLGAKPQPPHRGAP